MARSKIQIPEKFQFVCQIPIRISDLNYGGHVGNDTILSLVHEARIQFLHHHHYSELEFAGVGMIMADAAIEFKSELFYGDIVIASVNVGEFSGAGFEMIYKLEKTVNEKVILVAMARTGMVCYDYKKKKIAPVPEEARLKLKS